MYYIDSPLCEVSVFDYDLATGRVRNRRTAFKTPADWGVPDGMTIDAEGMLWVAQWGGWGVGRWDPASGQLLQRVKTGAAQTSSCAFGGPNLDILYMTSARTGITGEKLAAQPHAGGLFQCRPGARGLPAFAYGG
jgi:sugar lactone lactonase YvrE